MRQGWVLISCITQSSVACGWILDLSMPWNPMNLRRPLFFDWLYVVYSYLRDYLIHKGKSLLSVKRGKMSAIARRLLPLSREVYDTESGFTRACP